MRRGHPQTYHVTRTGGPGRRRGSDRIAAALIIYKIYLINILKQEEKNKMRRPRPIRHRLQHIQRLKGSAVPTRTTGPERTLRDARHSTNGVILTGLRVRVLCDPSNYRRVRVNKSGSGVHYKEVRTYTRGGAREKMAKACRRLTAGEQARKSHYKKKRGRRDEMTKGRSEGFTPKKEYHAKLIRGNYTGAEVTPGSPHDQRRQGGGGRREGGGSRGAGIPILDKGGTQCEGQNPRARAQ